MPWQACIPADEPIPPTNLPPLPCRPLQSFLIEFRYSRSALTGARRVLRGGRVFGRASRRCPGLSARMGGRLRPGQGRWGCALEPLRPSACMRKYFAGVSLVGRTALVMMFSSRVYALTGKSAADALRFAPVVSGRVSLRETEPPRCGGRSG